MSNRLDGMDGIIRKAIEELMVLRESTYDDSIDVNYEWSVDMNITEDVGYKFHIKEIIFTRFQNENVTRETQLEMLVKYTYDLIELNLMKETPSIPKVSSIN